MKKMRQRPSASRTVTPPPQFAPCTTPEGALVPRFPVDKGDGEMNSNLDNRPVFPPVKHLQALSSEMGFGL
jgi:hypothetical protein